MSERVSVTLPKIEGDPHVIIIKRYPGSSQGESDKNQKKYRYSFYLAQLGEDVTNAFEKVLSNYVDSAQKGENSIPIYHPDIEEYPCYVNLNPTEFQYWKDFQDSILNSESRSRKKPKKLESNLWGYMFYLHGGRYVIGYAKRLSPSKILKTSVIRAKLHNDIVLDSVQEVEGIEFDRSADFIFVIELDSEGNPSKSWGIIWNKGGFESLLDVYEHQKQKAMNILGQCQTLPQLLSQENLAKLKSTVEGNRQLHKMLLNPVTAKYMNEVTINDFKEVKEKFRDVSFDLDEEQGKVILPSPDSKKEYLKAIREVLSVLGARFTKTLNDDHILRGKPEELR